MLLAPLCALALACSGSRATRTSTNSAQSTPSGSTTTTATKAAHDDVIEALRRVTLEQKETLRLVQQLAHQVEVLQLEVLDLQEQQEELENRAAPPLPPARPQRPRPRPDAVYSIPIHDNPSEGSARPLVTIVKAFEFACPFCHKVGPTLDQLLQDYKGDLQVVHKHFIVHPSSATEPALAACAAGRQGKWNRMSQLIWKRAFEARDFSQKNLEVLARRAKLKMKQFREDRDGVCRDLIRRDQEEMRKVGTSGTPAFYINGRFLSGARPIDQFKALIDEELAKARERIRQDPTLSRTNYYEREILNKGLVELEPLP